MKALDERPKFRIAHDVGRGMPAGTDAKLIRHRTGETPIRSSRRQQRQHALGVSGSAHPIRRLFDEPVQRGRIAPQCAGQQIEQCVCAPFRLNRRCGSRT